MNNLKTMIKLMKYGYQTKINLLCGVGFLLFGIFAKVIGVVAPGFDIIFLLMFPIFVCQILYGLCYVKMISATGLKRWISVYLPDIFVDIFTIFALVLYYVLTVMRPYFPAGTQMFGVQYNGEESIGALMLSAGVMACIIMCFLAGCYKYYWITTIIFIVLMAFYGFFSSYINFNYKDGIEQWQGILAAVLFYLLGVVLSGVIRRALYKKPVSDKAVGKRLGEQS